MTAMAELMKAATLIAWLETKPAQESYNFFDCKGGCALSQYIKHHTGYSFRSGHYAEVAYARFADGQYFDNVAHDNDTFGSFLAAAKAAEGVS